jgi:hypothetical protein
MRPERPTSLKWSSPPERGYPPIGALKVSKMVSHSLIKRKEFESRAQYVRSLQQFRR